MIPAVAGVVFWAFMLLDPQLGTITIGFPTEQACEIVRQNWPAKEGQYKSDQCVMLLQPGGEQARGGKTRKPKIG